jgi:hypothetical protein
VVRRTAETRRTATFKHQELSMKLANGKTLTDDQLDRRLGRQYRKIEALHAEGACDHPATIPAGKWAEVLRGTRAATTDEESDVPTDADGPVDAHSRNRANDEAPRDGVPMHIGFKGFTHNGQTQR